MTKYKILVSDGDATAGTWYTLETFYEGASAKQAIQQALAEDESLKESPSGTYVAVPARSWDPVPVKPKQTFIFGE